MATTEQRLSSLEAKYDNLATKADLVELETRLIKWILGMMAGSIVAASTLALLIQRLTD